MPIPLFISPVQTTEDTDDISCETAYRGKDVHIFAGIRFAPKMTPKHITLAFYHIFHFGNVTTRKETSEG